MARRGTVLLRCIAVSLALAVAGCGDTQAPADSSVTSGASPANRGDLGTLTYRAVDILLAGAPDVGASTPLVVATISDVQDIETSSALGNIVADMIRTRLVQDGHSASEMRLRSAVSFIKKQGEFMLARNRLALMPPPNAAAIVTGTYAVGFGKVYVSLKLISVTDARILAGADFAVSLLDVVGLLPQARSP
ncbi:MAG TPA: FlgO family outer membrane protein [Acetobacteraceae bacterium]|nr:FlgO family outer membrane protein [Acetobacteraceae bacterium]